jgi:hypothetical protein
LGRCSVFFLIPSIRKLCFWWGDSQLWGLIMQLNYGHIRKHQTLGTGYWGFCR